MRVFYKSVSSKLHCGAGFYEAETKWLLSCVIPLAAFVRAKKKKPTNETFLIISLETKACHVEEKPYLNAE